MNRLIWAILIATRLRDRLRCPSCSAVGTFKLHAPTKNADGGEVPWRWLCKWCGYYRDKYKSGELCYPSRSKRCWVFFADDVESDVHKETPEAWRRDLMPNVWPWRG